MAEIREKTTTYISEFPTPELQKELRPFEDVELDSFTKKLLFRQILRPVSGMVLGNNSTVAANYGCFFIAERSYYVIAISECHTVAGTDGGAVTVTVEKCTSGTAPDSGLVLLTTAFSLKATANTPQFGTLTGTFDDLVLRRGDRLVLRDSGVLTSVNDVVVTVLLQEL